MVPLFLNNACPEGSLGILYHKPARRYKMGDEIRTAVSSRFAMFRRILGVPPEGTPCTAFFAKSLISDWMTSGIFTDPALSKLVTLSHENIQSWFMSDFPVFDAKTPVLKQVTLSKYRESSKYKAICGLREPKYNVTLEDKNSSVKKLNGMNPEFRPFAKRR